MIKTLVNGLRLLLMSVSILMFCWYILALPYVLLGVKGFLANAVGLYPFLYWAFCVLSCFNILRGRLLVTLGMVANIGLSPLIVWSLSHKGEWPIALICGAFIILWSLMCAGRLYSEKAST
jgi:hypothetical protein